MNTGLFVNLENLSPENLSPESYSKEPEVPD